LFEACDFPTRRIAARDLLVLPGLVDAHTHFREPGQAHKEGVDGGSRAALAGGVTTILDMPNNAPPITERESFEYKRTVFRAKCRVHWGLHVQARERPAPRPLGGGYASAKVYMARSRTEPALRDSEALARVLAAHPTVAVHAEDEGLFLDAKSLPPRSHHLQRPREAVRSALALLEEALARLEPHQWPRLVLCHATTADEVQWLSRMKRAGFDVWGETCPHYLLLTQDDYVREGPRLKVNPPLRTAEDRAALREGLKSGALDFIASAHAPHTPAEKADESAAPSGIPGIEWMLPALLSLVDEGVLGWERLVQVGTLAPARCYRLPRVAGIEEGARADLAIVRKRSEAPHAVITRAGYDPYSHLRVGWQVMGTVVAGQLAFWNGEIADCLGEEVFA